MGLLVIPKNTNAIGALGSIVLPITLFHCLSVINAMELSTFQKLILWPSYSIVS